MFTCTKSINTTLMFAVGRMFNLHNNSTVTTSIQGGKGRGGNILVNSPLMVLESSDIIANAKQGTGGNITISADQLIRTPDSVIQASSAQSVSGTITITAPSTDVAGSLVGLPETLFDVSSRLRVACAARPRCATGRHPVRAAARAANRYRTASAFIAATASSQSDHGVRNSAAGPRLPPLHVPGIAG
jgi:hypothetical protein